MSGTGAAAATVRAALAAVGLAAEADRILAAALPSTRLVLTAGEAPLDAARFGGTPVRRSTDPWPETGATPLTFLGQVELSSGAGLLAFYYDVAGMPWDSTNGPGWWVEHMDAGADLAQAEAPEGVAVLTPATIETFDELTLPFPRTAVARALGLEGEKWDAYCQAWGVIATEVRRDPVEDGQVHRLLGHPDAIQGDMTRRIAYGRAGADLEQHDPALEAEADEAVLLLQLDSDHKALGKAAVWANFGRLFFWITAADLAAGRFDRCELQLQC